MFLNPVGSRNDETSIYAHTRYTCDMCAYVRIVSDLHMGTAFVFSDNTYTLRVHMRVFVGRVGLISMSESTERLNVQFFPQQLLTSSGPVCWPRQRPHVRRGRLLIVARPVV